jgi:hypothetical protein
MRKKNYVSGIVTGISLALCAYTLAAETPKLKIRTRHGLPDEEQRKEQMERLAKEYDLSKYTITRDIEIDRSAMNHSSPTLTLNLRFLDNDDLALSAYVHEQAHWVLMSRNRFDNPHLLADLERAFPGLEYERPQGDGEVKSSYFHIAVCMLEWQAMEELVGPERAQKAIEWKQTDHYKAIYALVLSQRGRVEAVLKGHQVKW